MNLNKKIWLFFVLFLAWLFVFGTLEAREISPYEPFITKKLWRNSGNIDINIEKIIQDNFVNIPARVRTGESTVLAQHQAIRISIIKQLLRTNTVNFLHHPYSGNANFALTMKDNVLITTDVPEKDTLDELIDRRLAKMGPEDHYLVLSKSTVENLWPLFLRKSTADLEALGYEVVSSRYRTNNDAAYRRHNIITAFKFLGHVRVLNPGESIHYLKDAQFDERARKNYKNGLAIVSNDEISVYGGGICWGSTAAYQGFLTNTALDLGARNHSRWFSDLYTATINGKKISTPGIDATVYARSLELVVKNISDHPVVLVMNYNGARWGSEEIMSLGLESDKGSLEFVGKKWACYTRKINGKNKTSCYKEIH